jgi:WD40 repeat protein/transcriptional regulator with XRE-family HTH domain
MHTSQAPQSFRDLLLRLRGRTGLTQGQLAQRLGVSRRSVQDWEAGVNHPTAQRLQALITTLLEAGALTVGRELAEAKQMWDAVLSESPRMRIPLDEEWLSSLLAGHSDRVAPEVLHKMIPVTPEASQIGHAEDWGPAPDMRGFVDRAKELATVRGWVLDGRCRLAAVLGMGGIGKTALAARIAQDVAPNFQRVYWRSLRDSPSVSEWVAGAVRFLSDQQIVPPDGEAGRLEVLLRLLRERPSMLILDNFETILQPGDPEGGYRDGYAEYGTLLQAIGDGRHQSCLLLTSRESPPEFVLLDDNAARVFQLGGFEVDGGRALLTGKRLLGNADEWAGLVQRFAGNALALKVVSESIREVFGGELSAFLNEPNSPTVFGGIRRLLDEQFNRSSTVEQKVLLILAVEREPVSVAHLLAILRPDYGGGAVLEAVEALRRRSLVERGDAAGAAAITLQSVALEYVTDRLVEHVAEEIARGRPQRLAELPLIRAQAKDHVRRTQERLIGVAILQRMNAQRGRAGTQQALLRLLDDWRARAADEQACGPGNVVNLLRLLRGDLCGLDLSRLAIRHAYLAEVDAQDARLVDAHLVDSVLAESFDYPCSVALNGNGELLAIGTSTGQVCLWHLADRTLLWAVQGHTGIVWSLALATDGRLLASAGLDGAVRVWARDSGRLLATLQGHTGPAWGVAMSADGQLLASSGGDGSVRLWDTATGRALAILKGHTGAVWRVALTADGQLLASSGEDGTVRLWDTASGSERATLEGHTGPVLGVALPGGGELVASSGADGTVRLWETDTGSPLSILQGHTGSVWSVALAADGHLVASSGGDGTVRVWETGDGRPVAILQGHTGTVWSVALADDGQRVASGGGDGTARLWDTRTGQPVTTLQGHTGAIWGVALSADTRLLAIGSLDGTARVWETHTGRPVATFLGHTGAVWVVALSADGRVLASGGPDGTVRLWDTATRQPLAILEGHAGAVYGVALSADGQHLASGGADGTVRLWDTATRQPLAILEGHRGSVWSVALSADGHLLGSGSADGTVRLWDTSSRSSVTTLRGHSGSVWCVALSADAQLVASGAEDGTARLWDPHNGKPLVTLEGHTGGVYGLTLSADGQLLASGDTDGTARLWDRSTGRLLGTLRGHTGVLWGVALSADGQILASGGREGTVKIWETNSGVCLRTLRPDRRYERVDITGLTGINEAQRQALLDLGATEQHRTPAI